MQAGPTRAMISSPLLRPADNGFEAVLVFSGSGKPIDGWTRAPVPREIITVMAATLLGSVDTLLESLGNPKPQCVFLKVRGKRLLVQPADYGRNLIVIAEEHVSERKMAQVARIVLSQLPPPPSSSHGGR